MSVPDDSLSLTPSSSALGAFAHLPAYEFDFDYRGHTIRPPFSHLDNPFANPIVDDFDSYMFPDTDDPISPPLTHSEDPSLRSAALPSDLTSRNTKTTSSTSIRDNPLLRFEVDWPTFDASNLYSPDGRSLENDKLYTGYSRLVVLVFVPRHAVELCALVYGKIAHLLQQSGARLVFVTAWQPSQASTFLSRFERVSPFPGAIVCDPHASLFNAFGLMRSPFRALFSGSKVSAPMRQGVRNAFSTVTYRAQNRDIASTPVSSKRLKCGAVVMPCLRGYAKRPTMAYLNEESPSTGAGCYMDVLTTCGVNEAFVPDIDVAQVYARFNSMRITSIKARTADEKEAHRAQKQRGSRKSDRRNPLKVS